jgi:hypothetical protein
LVKNTFPELDLETGYALYCLFSQSIVVPPNFMPIMARPDQWAGIVALAYGEDKTFMDFMKVPNHEMLERTTRFLESKGWRFLPMEETFNRMREEAEKQAQQQGQTQDSDQIEYPELDERNPFIS